MLVLLWKPTGRSPAGGRLHQQRTLGTASCWGEHGAGSVGSSPVQRVTLDKSPDLAALHLQRKEWWARPQAPPVPWFPLPASAVGRAGDSLQGHFWRGSGRHPARGGFMPHTVGIVLLETLCLCLHRKAAQTRGTLTPQPCLSVMNGCVLVARGLRLAGATKPLCTAGRRCQEGGNTKISTARVHGPVIS